MVPRTCQGTATSVTSKSRSSSGSRTRTTAGYGTGPAGQAGDKADRSSSAARPVHPPGEHPSPSAAADPDGAGAVWLLRPAYGVLVRLGLTLPMSASDGPGRMPG